MPHKSPCSNAKLSRLALYASRLRAALLALCISTPLFSWGCAAAQAQYDYGDLTIYSAAEHYFTLENPASSVFVYYSMPQGLAELQEPINAGITHYGFTMVDQPEEADLIFIISLLGAQLYDQSAEDVYGSYYTPGAGDAALLATNPAGLFTLPMLALAAAGSVATGAVADATVNDWVRVQDFRIYGELMVKEKIPPEKESMYLSAAKNQDNNDYLYLSGDGYLVHHTRMYVGARDVNLTWDEYKKALGRKIADLATGNYRNNTFDETPHAHAEPNQP